MKELRLEAKVENLMVVQEALSELLEEAECPMAIQLQLEIAVEELFVNIAHYAYAPETGMAIVEMETTEDRSEVTVTFRDGGCPYDPLGKADPDLTLSAKERPIGGLGIYMVKKSMDAVEYKYEDGMNCLSIRKKLK